MTENCHTNTQYNITYTYHTNRILGILFIYILICHRLKMYLVLIEVLLMDLKNTIST